MGNPRLSGTFTDPFGRVYLDDVQHRFMFDPLYRARVTYVGQVCSWAGRFIEQWS